MCLEPSQTSQNQTQLVLFNTTFPSGSGCGEGWGHSVMVLAMAGCGALGTKQQTHGACMA